MNRTLATMATRQKAGTKPAARNLALPRLFSHALSLMCRRILPLLFCTLAFVSHGAIPNLSISRTGALFFAASDLTTNGVPGLSNAQSRALVSGVPEFSVHRGRVAVVNTQVWARFFQGPKFYDQVLSMARDTADNIVVAGYSDGATSRTDFAAIKYSSAGTALWTNRYDGPVHGDDYCRQVVVDGVGNIFVGDQSSYEVTNYLAMDAAVVKYSPAGVPLWTNRFNYHGTNAAGLTMAADQTGNLFLAIRSYPASPGFFLVKCDPAGVPVWTNYFRASGSFADYATAVAVDSAGDLIVTGYSSRPGTAGDYATLKYSSSGLPLWTNFFHRTFGDQPAALVVDGTGRVIVTGDAFYESYATVAYSGDGLPLWTNLLAHPSYSGGNVPRLAVDTSGYVFVTGGSAGANGEDADFTTLKLGLDGVPLWTNRFFETNIGNPFLGGTAVDAAGGFYLTGHSTAQPGQGYDFVTIKYLPDGTPAWTNRFHGPANGADLPQAITVDRSGAVYVAGQTAVPNATMNGGVWSFATVKYVEHIQYTPPPGFVGTDQFTFVATDPAGNSATNIVNITVTAESLWFDLLRSDLTGTGGTRRLHLDGANGNGPVVLSTSPDLVTWAPFATNTPMNGTVEFFIPSGGPRQFYRATQSSAQ